MTFNGQGGITGTVIDSSSGDNQTIQGTYKAIAAGGKFTATIKIIKGSGPSATTETVQAVGEMTRVDERADF